MRDGLERWIEAEGGMGMGVLCITHEEEGGRGGMRGWCREVVALRCDGG